MRASPSSWLLAALTMSALACRVEFGPGGGEARQGQQKKTVWLYTSMYKSVLAELRPLWERALPDVDVEVFQAGSERVAQRFAAEQAAGGSKACLLATSDPAWYRDLAERGELLAYVPPAALKMDERWVDPEGRWTTVRVSLMILATTADQAPTAFHDLDHPRWKNQVSSPDPLSSGTSFTTWTSLEAAYGPDWVRAVRDNGLVAAGGNSAVLSRIESGERPIGVILLENLLLAPHTPARPIFPTDGAVAVPGPLAIPKGCPNVLAAERFYSWLFSDEAQEVITGGGMHSPVPGAPPPHSRDGHAAPALDRIQLFPLPPEGYDLAGFKERWTHSEARE